MDLPDTRQAARAVQRAHMDLLNELMHPTDHAVGDGGSDFGLIEPDAQRLIHTLVGAVRTAALNEAEVMIRAHVASPLASPVFGHGMDFAADLIHDLATAPTTTEN